MPTEDLYTGIAVTGMFIIGVVLAMVKMPRNTKKNHSKAGGALVHDDT